MFAKQNTTTGDGPVRDIADPMTRRFLSGLLVGVAVGICLGRLIDNLF